MSRRYALRDDQWERIKDMPPGWEDHVGGAAKDNRLFVAAVLFRYRAGIPRRDLPERFGDFNVAHTRHMRLSRGGVFTNNNSQENNRVCNLKWSRKTGPGVKV